MKLSEAIRLGAMSKPQAFEGYTDGRGTCAIGAALDALGVLKAAMAGQPVNLPDWKQFSTARSACPDCHGISSLTPCLAVVAHLNDEHHWTRERIADWVESVEQTLEAQPVHVEAVTV